jgi:(p)ppGpp synthase/HD superfamily hydrolase
MSDSIQTAQDFAAKAHKGQMYGSQPYTYHLVQVANVLTRFGFDDTDLHVAAWLHDVVEDTDTTVEDVQALVGDVVADIVQRVTDEPGANRKERKAKTYPMIKGDVSATLIKLADRIANVENCIATGKRGLYGMYCKEQPEFRKALFVDAPETASLWAHLEAIT